MRRRVAVLAALLTAGPLAAATDGPPDRLALADTRLVAATAAVEAAAMQGGPDADAAIDALAAAMTGQEAALAELRAEVGAAAAREGELALELARRGDETARLLAAMQAASRAPEAAAGLHPEGPLAAARAAALMQRIQPWLRAEAAEISARLAEVEQAQAARDRGAATLDEGLRELAAARGTLRGALAGQATAPVSAAAGVAAADAREADSLSELADRLAPAAPLVDPDPQALRRPVVGRVLRGFREPDGAGMRRPGLTLAAAPLTLVTAPADASVRYAGPFLDYGYVVVLQLRPDAVMVLAGMATLATDSGAVVRAGAPLGFLGGREVGAQEFLMLGEPGTGETPDETLYIELRHGRGPVDPAPWFDGPNGWEVAR